MDRWQELDALIGELTAVHPRPDRLTWPLWRDGTGCLHADPSCSCGPTVPVPRLLAALARTPRPCLRCFEPQLADGRLAHKVETAVRRALILLGGHACDPVEVVDAVWAGPTPVLPAALLTLAAHDRLTRREMTSGPLSAVTFPEIYWRPSASPLVEACARHLIYVSPALGIWVVAADSVGTPLGDAATVDPVALEILGMLGDDARHGARPWTPAADLWATARALAA